MTVVHDFDKSLALSHAAEDLPFWKEVYSKAFPTMIAMHNHRQDGDHQRQGIDRSIILENSKQILIDEKVRFKAYNDILLEYWSNEKRQVPGWVCKPLLADYIAYAIAPLGKCYLLPVLQLQEAWRRHGKQWIEDFTDAGRKPPICARNKCRGREWRTISIAVSVKQLFMSIGKVLRIDFEPYEKDM